MSRWVGKFDRAWFYTNPLYKLIEEGLGKPPLLPLDYFLRFILDKSGDLFWRAASPRLSRPTATARQLERRSCIFHVNQKSWADRSSSLSLAPGEEKNVAGSGEKDGKPAEKAGSHDQRPAVCDQLGKFAGKFHECLMHLKAPLPGKKK